MSDAIDWRAEMRARFLEWRDVETPCERCQGSGRCAYGSTATWRGGIGGATMTADVCDACWGTGDAHRKGADLRALRASEDRRVADRAARLLAERLGAPYAELRPALRAVADELERMSRGRKARPRHYYETCERMARLLTEMVGRDG